MALVYRVGVGVPFRYLAVQFLAEQVHWPVPVLSEPENFYYLIKKVTYVCVCLFVLFAVPDIF